VTASDRARELALVAAQAAADKLAADIVLLDVESIVDEVEEKLRRIGAKPVRREGERQGRWVLLDYVDIVVHVQHAEERVYYGLERLWKDCPAIPFRDAARAAPTGPGARARA
jgi:ribosome-associated protein